MYIKVKVKSEGVVGEGVVVVSSPVDTPRDFRSVGVDGIFIRVLQFGAGPGGLDDIPNTKNVTCVKIRN